MSERWGEWGVCMEILGRMGGVRERWEEWEVCFGMVRQGERGGRVERGGRGGTGVHKNIFPNNSYSEARKKYRSNLSHAGYHKSCRFSSDGLVSPTTVSLL